MTLDSSTPSGNKKTIALPFNQEKLVFNFSFLRLAKSTTYQPDTTDFSTDSKNKKHPTSPKRKGNLTQTFRRKSQDNN